MDVCPLRPSSSGKSVAFVTLSHMSDVVELMVVSGGCGFDFVLQIYNMKFGQTMPHIFFFVYNIDIYLFRKHIKKNS